MFCRETRYATANEQRLAAEEVAQRMTHQREQMSAQLFGLTQENAALKEEVRVLEQRLAGEQADKEAQARNLSNQSPVLECNTFVRKACHIIDRLRHGFSTACCPVGFVRRVYHAYVSYAYCCQSRQSCFNCARQFVSLIR